MNRASRQMCVKRGLFQKTSENIPLSESTYRSFIILFMPIKQSFVDFSFGSITARSWLGIKCNFELGYVFIQCVTGGMGLCGQHIQELLLYHPKQKPRRGGGLRQINTCRQVPLLVIF
jgi:hypothetical protein